MHTVQKLIRTPTLGGCYNLETSWLDLVSVIPMRLNDIDMTASFCRHFCGGLSYSYSVLNSQDCLCTDFILNSTYQGKLYDHEEKQMVNGESIWL